MKNRIAKKFIALAALVLAAVFAAGCGEGCLGCTGCGVEKDPTVVDVTTEAPVGVTETPAPTGTDETEEPPAPTDTPIPEYISMRYCDGFIKANKNGTYGVGVDGSVRYRGSGNTGLHRIYEWENVVDLETNDTTAAALMRDSSIRIIGFYKSAFSSALEWKGIVDLAMGDSHLAGLRTDGTVIACGENKKGQCEVTEWTLVQKVVAAGTYTAALTENGVVTTIGAEFDEKLNAFHVSDIAAAPDHIVLLLGDGTVRSVNITTETDSSRDGKSGDSSGGRSGGGKQNGNSVESWQGIVKVFAAKGATYAIDGSGKLYSTSSMIDEQIDNAYCVGASETHAVVLRSDGTCKSFGDNACMQGRVSNWRLLPYVTDEGWLIGYGPGTYVNGQPAVTGMQTVYTDPATGETRDATFIILGDANGDGRIDQSDVQAVTDHISGSKKLTGAYARAANVIMDSSKPDSIDVVDLEKITAEAAGEHAIDRFAKTDQYTALLADAKRKNQDTMGYITIKGTNISYPIMYDFNWFYNDHDIDRNQATRGSIYFYWGKLTRNIVITGHNSRSSGTMFHELHKVQNEKSKLENYKNRVWAINAYGRTDYWEVWALYEEPAFKDASQSSQYYNTNFPGTFNSLTEQERQAWINYQQQRSELGYSVSVTTEDRFMTLLTCGDDHQDSAKGARLYIFLRWVGND